MCLDLFEGNYGKDDVSYELQYIADGLVSGSVSREYAHGYLAGHRLTLGCYSEHRPCYDDSQKASLKQLFIVYTHTADSFASFSVDELVEVFRQMAVLIDEIDYLPPDPESDDDDDEDYSEEAERYRSLYIQQRKQNQTLTKQNEEQTKLITQLEQRIQQLEQELNETTTK